MAVGLLKPLVPSRNLGNILAQDGLQARDREVVLFHQTNEGQGLNRLHRSPQVVLTSCQPDVWKLTDIVGLPLLPGSPSGYQARPRTPAFAVSASA